MGSPHLLGAHRKPMVPALKEMELKRHVCLSQGSCQMQTVLHRDRWVGDSVPEEHRACFLGDLVFQAQQGAKFGIASTDPV
ncbi:hypothetical protein SDC9_91833 [bioreactor metagenome]|uniref:Uncharacterized protein n=1 Tax=bioreactor metagenome TaxID=1076179 RepID=A0A644ZWM1_9ZZZZ